MATRPLTEFIAQRYAIAVYAVALCLSVYLSVCLSITSRYCTKWLDVASSIWRQKYQRNSNGVTPNGDANYRRGRLKSAIFDKHLAISQKRCRIWIGL